MAISIYLCSWRQRTFCERMTHKNRHKRNADHNDCFTIEVYRKNPNANCSPFFRSKIQFQRIAGLTKAFKAAFQSEIKAFVAKQISFKSQCFPMQNKKCGVRVFLRTREVHWPGTNAIAFGRISAW